MQLIIENGEWRIKNYKKKNINIRGLTTKITKKSRKKSGKRKNLSTDEEDKKKTNVFLRGFLVVDVKKVGY